ncbi:Uncharacterised protein [Burkholderia pseudomallei]|nr:Uncharacterised protein [Burkholderia pseudomallei]CAJ4807841.1 Uncharacterised protein [Burkholderia pseudomallei]
MSSQSRNLGALSDRAALLELLKRVAKREKARRRDEEFKEVQLSSLLDKIAASLGYRNWSLLHKDAIRMPADRFAALKAQAHGFPDVQEFQRYGTLDKEAARLEMREYVEGNFTQLIEFAFYDSESENGFAWPSVDLHEELGAEFGERFPPELIAEVASDMELNDGPWGIEDYGDDDRDDHEPSDSPHAA